MGTNSWESQTVSQTEARKQNCFKPEQCLGTSTVSSTSGTGGNKCQGHCGFTGRNTEQKVACPHFSDVLSPFQEYRPYNAPTEFTAPWRNIHNSQHVKEHPRFLAEDQHDLVEHLLALYDQRAVMVDLIYLPSPLSQQWHQLSNLEPESEAAYFC